MQKSVQNKIQSLNWEEMEKTPCIPEIDDSEFCVRVPGGGITKMLYDEGWVCLPVSLSPRVNVSACVFAPHMIWKWKQDTWECLDYLLKLWKCPH